MNIVVISKVITSIVVSSSRQLNFFLFVADAAENKLECSFLSSF